MVEAIHCTVAPVQACEASAQSLLPRHSCHRLSWAYDWSGFQCGSTVAPVAGQLGTSPSTSVHRGTQSSSQNEFQPHPTPTPAHSPVTTRQVILKGAGSFTQPLRVSERLAALVDDDSEASKVPGSVRKQCVEEKGKFRVRCVTHSQSYTSYWQGETHIALFPSPPTESTLPLGAYANSVVLFRS